MTASLYEAGLTSVEAAAAFDAAATLQAVLDFEAALVRAEAAESRMPAAAAQAIAGICKIGLFDLPSLVAAAAVSGDLVTPLLARLRETVSLFDSEAARFVSGGEQLRSVALQTALVLQLRRVLALIDRDLGRLLHEMMELSSLEALAGNPLSTRPIELAAARLLATQRRLRECGAAALQLRLVVDSPAPSGAWELSAPVANRIAEQLELQHTVDPAVDRDADLIRLACELAMSSANLERFTSSLPRLLPSAGEAAGSSDADSVELAAAVVRACALRAPQRLASLLALAADDVDCQLPAAEAAALLASVHGSVRAARRATLACRMLLQADQESRKQRRAPVAASNATPATGEYCAALWVLVRQQAAQAPWQRWAS